MKFVKLIARGVDLYVNPAHVTAVAYNESEGAVGLVINGEADPIYVRGAPMEVVAALEAATATEFAAAELVSAPEPVSTHIHLSGSERVEIVGNVAIVSPAREAN